MVSFGSRTGAATVREVLALESAPDRCPAQVASLGRPFEFPRWTAPSSRHGVVHGKSGKTGKGGHAHGRPTRGGYRCVHGFFCSPGTDRCALCRPMTSAAAVMHLCGAAASSHPVSAYTSFCRRSKGIGLAVDDLLGTIESLLEDGEIESGTPGYTWPGKPAGKARLCCLALERASYLGSGRRPCLEAPDRRGSCSKRLGRQHPGAWRGAMHVR